ncbi:MAG TPA: glycosyl hydrolase, partial [Pelobium sp.]|nr:glycosyl hydrolase [Pelobium sp.]
MEEARRTGEELDKKDTSEHIEVTTEELDEEEIQHVNNPIVGLKPIEKEFLGAVKEVRQENNKFIFTDGSASVEIRVVSDEIIRVRLAPHSVFLEEFSYAVPQLDQKVAVFNFTEDETHYAVSTNTVSCLVNKANFHISFRDIDSKVINEDYLAMHWEENEQFGGYYVYCTKKCYPDEAYFGLGDKPTDLNLRGKRLQNWNSDTYSFAKHQDPLYRSIPFFISLNENIAHGIFLDNTFKTHFDFAQEDKEKLSFWADGGELQYYYIHGPHMMDVVKRY